MKPFLGGYKIKNTTNPNISEYHHATTQTIESDLFEKYRQKVTKDTSKLNSRNTQTQELRSNCTHQQREYGTQMDRQNIYIDNKFDKLLYTKTYFTSEELHDLKTKKAVIIQSIWKGALARKLVSELKAMRKQVEDDNIIKLYVTSF